MAPVGRLMAHPETGMSLTELDIELDLVFPRFSSLALPDSVLRLDQTLTERELRFKSRQQRQIEKEIDDVYRFYFDSFL